MLHELLDDVDEREGKAGAFLGLSVAALAEARQTLLEELDGVFELGRARTGLDVLEDESEGLERVLDVNALDVSGEKDSSVVEKDLDDLEGTGGGVLEELSDNPCCCVQDLTNTVLSWCLVHHPCVLQQINLFFFSQSQHQ